jgi:hypothetical protein
MKEASGAALCSSPTPALGLRHRLCPTARHRLALGGGRSFSKLQSSLTAGLWRRRFQHCLYWLDPQRTRYRYGYGSPWSLAGLVHALRRASASLLGLGRRRRGGIVIVIIVHSEWGPSSTPNIQFVLCGAKQNYFYIKKTPRLGKGGPSSPHFDQCQAWNWGPHGWSTASPWRRVRRYSSRRGGDGGKANVAITEEGGRLFYRPFCPLL